MTDIREQVLQKTFDKHEHRLLDYPQINSKAGVLDAMDEYGIKILQYLHDNGQDFSANAEFDAKEYLEEIKTELK